MFETLELSRMAQSLASHAGRRMGIIAQNLAHADTPGYRAQDMRSFADTLAAEGAELRRTRMGHVGTQADTVWSAAQVPGAESPNGNSVSLEGEMVKAAVVRQQHDMALAIYRSTSGVIRAALGRS